MKIRKSLKPLWKIWRNNRVVAGEAPAVTLKVITERVTEPMPSSVISNHNEKELDTTVAINTPVSPSSLSFNDTDGVVKFDSATGTVSAEMKIDAPKTLDRLEAISTMRNEQRRREDAEEEEEEEYTKERIMIMNEGPSLKLDALDVQVLGEDISLKDKPVLTGVEVLSGNA